MHFHQYDHYISFDIGEHGGLPRHFVHIRGDNKAQKHQRDSRSCVFASFKQQVAISFMLISMQNDRGGAFHLSDLSFEPSLNVCVHFTLHSTVKFNPSTCQHH